MSGDLVIENGDQVVQALQPILDKLGITGPKLWEMFLRHAKTKARLDACVFIGSSLAGVLTLVYLCPHVATSAFFTDVVFSLALSLLIGLFAGLLLSCMGDCVLSLAYPEYYAAKDMLSSVRGSK